MGLVWVVLYKLVDGRALRMLERVCPESISEISVSHYLNNVAILWNNFIPTCEVYFGLSESIM